MRKRLIFTILLVQTLFCYSKAQTKTWYDSAQIRIDTLRKGNFTFKVTDNDGNGVQDSVKIIHKKHEFPWGTAIDLACNAGNNYTSAQPVIAPSDSEVYHTERWASYLAYNLPSVKGKNYKLTIKLSEIFFSSTNLRLFDIYVDGQRIMQNIDKYALAKGQYKAFDTTVNVKATDNLIKLEFIATKDNVSIMGIVLSDSTGAPVLRLNCSGSDITTKKGDLYVSDLNYLDKSSPNDNWIKAVMLKYCNYGVCGNQFKWSGIEPVHRQLNYAPFENTLSWFKKVGWDMRAHTLLWGGNNSTDYHCIPQWVMSLSSSPKAMYDTCKMRVIREVTRYKGMVKEYDVLNEPTHANYLQKQVGDSINWNCFKWAHEADPDARLFINDYNIIEWQDQTDNFVALVKKMLQKGAPITGIGAQCHIGSSVDIPNFKKRFDQLGQFGLPIKVTEFDMAAKSLFQVQYAAEISKMMRLAFSHPAIEGFIFWGLTEPTWVPESIVNLIGEDKTAKIAADSVYHLLHGVWTTKITALTDISGTYSFNGYYGNYDVLVKVGGKWKKFNVWCKEADKNKLIVLKEGDGVATSPILKKVCIKSPTSIELIFDKSMSDPSKEIRNYMVFDTVTNSVQSAALKAGDSTTILLKTKSQLLTKNYIPVAYYPGNQTSADDGLLEPFGPVYINGYVSTYRSSKTSKDGRYISVAFNKKLADTSIHMSNFIIKVDNVNNIVTQASLNGTKDTLYLTLTNRIVKSADVISITYQPGSLLTTDGFIVADFNNKTVANLVLVPAFVSAATSSDGATLQLGFSQSIADPTGQESAFMVTVNAKNNQVTNAELLDSNNKDVILTLSSGIYKGDTVSIIYNPGSLVSSLGVPVPAFSAAVNNNSTSKPTVIESVTNNNIECYPNPFGDQLFVSNANIYQSIAIKDMFGRKVIQLTLNQNGITAINTSALASGIYVVTLSNSNDQLALKVLKL